MYFGGSAASTRYREAKDSIVDREAILHSLRRRHANHLAHKRRIVKIEHSVRSRRDATTRAGRSGQRSQNDCADRQSSPARHSIHPSWHLVSVSTRRGKNISTITRKLPLANAPLLPQHRTLRRSIHSRRLLRLRPPPYPALPRPLDRLHRLLRRHLDAGHRRHLADDRPHRISPLLIALMQTAASLPVLILGLLAGATADIFDRRKLLIFWQAWMLVSVAILAVLNLSSATSRPGLCSPSPSLLNVGSAMNNPAWQAIVPELVPRDPHPSTSVALNAASNNLARALGPAARRPHGRRLHVRPHRRRLGLRAQRTSPSPASSGSSSTGSEPPSSSPHFPPSASPAPSVAASATSATRLQLQSLARPRLRILPFLRLRHLVTACRRRKKRSPPKASSPLTAPSATASSTAALGLGAVAGATQVARIRANASPPIKFSLVATLYEAFTLLVLAFLPQPWMHHPHPHRLRRLPGPASMSSINTSVQLAVPPWVTARALGTYLMTFQGGMTLGSVLWGLHRRALLALPTALATAAARSCVITLPLRPSLQNPARAKSPDFSPYQFKRPAPQLVDPLASSPAPHTSISPTLSSRKGPSASPSITTSPSISYARLHPPPSTPCACRSPPRWRHPLGHLPRRRRSHPPQRVLHHGILARLSPLARAHHRRRHPHPRPRIRHSQRGRTSTRHPPGLRP